MGFQLIVGLGNPGPEYADTRHNVGFMVVEKLLQRAGHIIRTTNRGGGSLATARIAGQTAWLLRPMTFMNRSGEVVEKAAASLELSVNDILVCYDCLDLPLGKIRLRQRGSSGGHKGVESIIRELGSAAFTRLRVGIGRPAGDTVGYVLSGWEDAERPILNASIEAACDAVFVALTRGVECAMNRFNAWQHDPAENRRTEPRQGEQN